MTSHDLYYLYILLSYLISVSVTVVDLYWWQDEDHLKIPTYTPFSKKTTFPVEIKIPCLPVCPATQGRGDRRTRRKETDNRGRQSGTSLPVGQPWPNSSLDPILTIRPFPWAEGPSGITSPLYASVFPDPGCRVYCRGRTSSQDRPPVTRRWV